MDCVKSKNYYIPVQLGRNTTPYRYRCGGSGGRIGMVHGVCRKGAPRFLSMKAETGFVI